MSDATNDRHQPLADPAAQRTDRDDTSIVPDLTEDPVEQEESRLDDAPSRDD